MSNITRIKNTKLYSLKPILWVLPLTHKLPIDIIYKHTNTNIDTGLKGKQ